MSTATNHTAVAMARQSTHSSIFVQVLCDRLLATRNCPATLRPTPHTLLDGPPMTSGVMDTPLHQLLVGGDWLNIQVQHLVSPGEG
jgi:hypothetical protein